MFAAIVSYDSLAALVSAPVFVGSIFTKSNRLINATGAAFFVTALPAIAMGVAASQKYDCFSEKPSIIANPTVCRTVAKLPSLPVVTPAQVETRYPRVK